MSGETSNFQCQHLAMVEQWRGLMANLWQNWFSNHVFYVTIVDADIKVLSLSINYLVKHFDHMLIKFEQNCMVWTTQKFWAFWKKKWLTIYDKASTLFWKMFL